MLCRYNSGGHAPLTVLGPLGTGVFRISRLDMTIGRSGSDAWVREKYTVLNAVSRVASCSSLLSGWLGAPSMKMDFPAGGAYFSITPLVTVVVTG